MKSNRPHARGAFTLTEVLVVCIIIGILMSLVANAVFSAIGTAKEAAIANEIDKMRIAVEQLKTEYRGLPPTDLRFPDNSGSEIYKFFAASFQNYNISKDDTSRPGANKLEEDLIAEGINYTDYDPGYALVFWLVGFSPDTSNPLRGHGRRMGWDPEWTGAAGEGDTAEIQADLSRAYYEFVRERLVRGHYFPQFTEGDLGRYYTHADDGNGIWDADEVFDGHNAFLYFDADSSYKGLLDNDPAAPEADKAAIYKGFQPYRKLALTQVPTGLPTTTGFSKLRSDRDPHYNNDTYQIVSAGLDEDLGAGGRPPAADEPYLSADADNITNFSQGTMGDLTDR